jgi:predicted nucleic acid-binding protein
MKVRRRSGPEGGPLLFSSSPSDAGSALFTSNYAFAETYTTLLVRVGRREAIEWGRRFRAGDAIDLVHLDRTTEDLAWEILEQHEDERWS